MASYIKYLVFTIALLYPAVSLGQGGGELYDTSYATIRYSSVDDFNACEKNLRGGIFIKAHGPDSNYMAGIIDGIFEKVEFLLDMYPKDLKVSIELYGNRRDLENAYRGLGVNRDVPQAYYSSKNRKMYINARDVNIGVMAHEFAHAIICAYFNNEVPEKTQEILAQHVDEQIKEFY